MAGISTGGSSSLPTPQDLFAGSGAAPVAPTAPQTGPLVSGPGGSTQLPDAAPGDFAGTNPTPLDQPHPQYPALIQSHVAVLQAIGTPEAVIAQLNASQPQAEYMDRYIQGEIMQNPEGWDSFVGNPAGTARQGLQALIPGIQLPAPGQGNAGYMPDGSPVSGVQVPGVSTPVTSGPMLDPTTGNPNGGGILPWILGAAAVAGVGLLAWKFLGKKNAAQETERVAGLLANGQGGGTGGIEGLKNLLGSLGKGGVKGDELVDVQRALALQAVAGGGLGGVGGNGVHTAATLESIMRGHGAANGFLNSVGSSAVAFNMSMPQAAELALADRGMGVLEQLARNGGTVADLAAARVLTTQLGTATAAGGQAATQLSGLRTALAGLANLAV